MKLHAKDLKMGDVFTLHYRKYKVTHIKKVRKAVLISTEGNRRAIRLHRMSLLPVETSRTLAGTGFTPVSSDLWVPPYSDECLLSGPRYSASGCLN